MATDGLSRLDKLNNDMQAVRAEIARLAKEEGGAIIRELCQPLFDLGVTAASWTQYTPYFNDGDPCDFRVNSNISVRFTPPSDEDSDYEDDDDYPWFDRYTLSYKIVPWELYDWSAKNRSERQNMEAQESHESQRAQILARFDPAREDELFEAMKEVGKVLGKNQEMLLAAFGDHVRVIVTSTGVETEEYIHE